MDYFSLFTLFAEIVGTISFSISGAVAAVKKGMDLFGVIILGLTTAVGGGVIRDLILGVCPPKTFTNPIYGGIAIVVAAITFVVISAHKERRPNASHELLSFWMDAVGLAVFTVVGISTAYGQSDSYGAYLLVFVGVITGVGGGVIRDLFAGNTPYIFVKHIYACACIVGSLVCVLLWKPFGMIPAMTSGAAVIVALRCLARRFKWNLPRIRPADQTLDVQGLDDQASISQASLDKTPDR